jgi:hypothetical protein
MKERNLMVYNDTTKERENINQQMGSHGSHKGDFAQPSSLVVIYQGSFCKNGGRVVHGDTEWRERWRLINGRERRAWLSTCLKGTRHGAAQAGHRRGF